MDILVISKEINENAHSKGFWDKGIDVPEKLILIVSEIIEAMEADRVDKRYDNEYNIVYHNQGEFFNSIFEHHCKNTFEDELADAAIRIFDLAFEMGIDLSAHIEYKHRYNKSRPHMHGGKKY
jgi:NTP pyrophosphatase (non-canonical NTP hydrolase)